MTQGPKPSLANLMARVGLPGITSAERAAEADAVSRELAARKFAAAYLELLDAEKAYIKALRPNAKLGWRKTRARAARWLAEPRVRELVRAPLQEAITRAELDVKILAERIVEHANSDLFDYAEWDDQGRIIGFKFDVARMTPAQRRSVRQVKLEHRWNKKEERFEALVTDMRLVDSQKAIDSAMALVALNRKMGEDDPNGTIPGELAKRLENVSKYRETMLSRLPKSRTAVLIEQEKAR